jgi:hypothetical protein
LKGQVIHRYTVFGLAITSEVELPSLQRLQAGGDFSDTADVHFFNSDLSKSVLESGQQVGAFAEVAKGEALIRVPGLGRFLMSDGCRIDIEPEPGYDLQTMELYLLGNMLGVLLLQKRFLVMHGNVLERNGSAVMLCGCSGSGKSTLSAALIKSGGFRLVSDDLAVFDQHGNLREGPAELKLWRDAVQALELPLDEMQPLHAQVEKYRWFQKAHVSPSSSLKVKAIYILGSNNLAGTMELSELAGMAKLLPLKNQVYRRQFVEAMGLKQHHFVMISSVLGAVPVVQVNRALVGLKEGAVESLAEAVMSDLDHRIGVL